MSDYIRREDAIRLAEQGQLQGFPWQFQMLVRLPSADVVQVRHGKWTHKPDVHGVVYCSECDYELHINTTSFCPNCGAKMDAQGEE